MKKFGLLLVGGIAAIVFLANIGPLLALVITLGIAYLVMKEFLKAKTTGSKIIWGIIGLIFLGASISNIPSVLALIAAYVMYLIYKNWNGKKPVDLNKNNNDFDNDPFMNFEREWENLNRN
ncbi:flagellar basal body rod protein [Bacillus sp. JJ722]|uniref:lmo0954 family membrane protein n=1 Tax=Bacillus sp. JJ722 TaxID=3122973 RepID=UPI0030007ED6